MATGETITCPGALFVGGKTVESCGANDTFAFQADKTFTLAIASTPESGGYRARGIWRPDNVTLTLTFTEFATDTNGDGAFTGDEITGPPPAPDNQNRQRIAFAGTNTFTDIAAGSGETATTYTFTRL